MRKDELRHDPVRENIVKSIEYIKDNKSTVLKIFTGFFILIGCFSYYNHTRSVKIVSASNIAGLSQNTFINGEIDEAIVKFERVLNDYPSTSGATQSLVFLLNDWISQQDFKGLSSLILKYKDSISNINDPVVQSIIYKIQGDMAIIDGKLDDAISHYRKAEYNSGGSANHIKYQLDIISALIAQENYIEAKNILENIIDLKDVSYNEKNKAEELIAFVNHKLGT